jgi:hypothetical protein
VEHPNNSTATGTTMFFVVWIGSAVFFFYHLGSAFMQRGALHSCSRWAMGRESDVRLALSGVV